MKKEKRKASQDGLRILFAVIGSVLFLVGMTTSLLLGLVGSFLIAVALASYLERKVGRLLQVLILLGGLVVCASIVYGVLGWKETWKRSCIPVGDCAARHEFNSLEKLDHDVFGLYQY
jgi:hypothetical protein